MTHILEPTTLEGTRYSIALHRWSADDPTHVVLLAHGYAEHAGRYVHVAARLVEDGAAVYAADHLGHGYSDGPRALTDVAAMADDLGLVQRRAATEHPDLPVALIGHSLGGLIAVTYVQSGGRVDALVLSGPFIGGNPQIAALLELDPIPEVPIDPAALSRDPQVGAAYADDPLVYHGPFERGTLADVFAAVDSVAAGASLGTLPTLWIHGELDPLAPGPLVRAALERLRPQRLEECVYPGAMHEVFNEINREEVLDDVAAFIDSVVTGRRSRR
jgi:alpha-beta hydrolase superfamily lysophospholipase